MVNKPLYRIKNWSANYEFGDYKKCTRATWYPKQTKHDGKGYRRIIKMKNGPEIYLAWTLIEAVASKCPTRGTLADDDGPLDAHDLELMTEVPARYFENAFKPLVETGWLEVIGKSSESFGSVPNHSESLGKTPLTVQDSTDTTGQESSGGGNSRKPAINDQALAIYKAYPKKTDKQAALAQIRKILSDPKSGKSFEFLLDATTAYAQAVSAWPVETLKYIPSPERWFKKGKYDDDRSTWERDDPGKHHIEKGFDDPDMTAMFEELAEEEHEREQAQ